MDHHQAYHDLRTLVEQCLGPQSALHERPELAPLAAHMRAHCRECGNRLPPDQAEGSSLCAGCAQRQQIVQAQQDQATITALLVRYGAPADLAARLAAYLLSAPDRELYRVNPHWLAEQLECPVRPLLAALAPAVLAGVLVLNWELYCLACHYQAPTFTSLKTATSKQTCKNCHATYQAPLDQEIAITFTVAPALRPLALSTDDADWREHLTHLYPRLMGHELMSVQAFHDLLVREPLPEHEQFQITRMAILFTDLSGSTALYARQGDPRAYGLVQNHFDLLIQIISTAGGAVVKTIGDAVMAVFSASSLALSAAMQAQQAIAELNQSHESLTEELLQLKIGLHSGPCLAVTLNERLDYFGTTVNVAARIQKLAQPGEIVLTEAIYQDVQESNLLATYTPDVANHRLRGLEDQPWQVYTLRAADPAAKTQG